MSVVDAIERQRHFFESGQTRSLEFRREQLNKFKIMLKDNEKLLMESIHSDFKKSSFETYTTELALVYLEIDEALKKLKKWTSRKKVRHNLVNLPGQSYILPEPLGICLVIGAWNYPIQLSLAPAVAVLAAGNTVILKPSELPSNTSHTLAQLIKTYFAPGLFSVIEGGVPETTELLQQKFDKIFFTGSVAVGRIVYEAAARQLTPVTLELGGKSPAIIAPDADIKITAKRITWGKFLNAGQTCIAPDYVLVHKSLADVFTRAMVDEIKKSDYHIDNDNYVQIINEQHFDRLVSLINAHNVYHGGAYNKTDRTIEPTLLTKVHLDDEIMEDEIFGPLLPIIVYEDIDEILEYVNSKPKPLACYIFTRDAKIKDKVIQNISFGGGVVNDTLLHISNTHLPFGGVGDSGIGKYHGYEGFRTFSHFKSIMEKRFFYEPDLRFSPYSSGKLNWIKRLLGLS
ncbi:MAG: aldehyde dehydrogenase family protein [Cyclobacteriaceae bacterium]|nr:aldehyde dehydrogenase family protein [Cyclobacteriaceae bacterium]